MRILNSWYKDSDTDPWLWIRIRIHFLSWIRTWIQKRKIWGKKKEKCKEIVSICNFIFYFFCKFGPTPWFLTFAQSIKKNILKLQKKGNLLHIFKAGTGSAKSKCRSTLHSSVQIHTKWNGFAHLHPTYIPIYNLHTWTQSCYLW